MVKGQEGGLLPQLRGVKVVRDGQVVCDLPAEVVRQKEAPPIADSGRGVRAPSFEARDFQEGDQVRLRNFGSMGIIDRIKNDEAELRVGSLHMREKLANLELISERGTSSTVSEGSLERMRKHAATELHLHSKSPAGKAQHTTELNLIGKTTDEAVDLVDKFLDEAFLNGQRQLRIIHGHGTGALRRAVAELLADHPHVERFSAAPHEKGGTGVTLVELPTA
jgi:DNA mismatch repair protein MutS2